MTFITNNLLATLLGPIPSPDPLGYPLPIVIIQALSYLTLTLHFLAMNFTLGGLILLLWSRWRKGHEIVARFFGSSLTLGFSYLVTFGIPPLLFIQVLYGQVFYTSSVLVGAFWILVIPLLITAYACLYAHKLTKDRRPPSQGIILLIALFAMLFVGFIYVNNLTLSMTPEKWMSLYKDHPGGGSLNLEEQTLVPRYLLFITPTLVVAGLALIIAGGLLSKWGDSIQGKAMQTFGLRSFIIGRIVMIAVATLFITTLPKQIYTTIFTNKTQMLFFIVGITLAILNSVLVFIAAKKPKYGLAIFAAHLMFFELAAFVILRDQVRINYLAEHFQLSLVPVNVQWGMFGIFVAALVAGLMFLIPVTIKVVKNMIVGFKEDLTKIPT